MAVTTHSSLPATIQAGDTLTITESISQYSAASWTLHYAITGNGKVYKLDFTASGTDHTLTTTAAVTGSWKAGEYVYHKYVDNTSGERVTISKGQLRIQPNIGEQDPDLDQWREIHTRAKDGLVELAKGRTVSFSVAGQSFTLLSMDEAVRLERIAKRKVRDLEREAKMAAGLGSRRRISFRF